MRLRIKDITTKVGSGITPRGGAESYLEQGIPLFRSQNVHNNGFLYDDIAYISDEVDEIMSNTRVKAGDVLLNITGASIGRCFYIPEDFECGNVNQHVCIIRPKKHIVKSAYLHFCIISDEGQEQIKFMQTGANRDGLAVEDIKSFSFDIPSLQVQQCIVDYLEAKTTEIDKKIELLGKKRDAYNRLKTATINRAVTQGLDEHVPLKDSGMDWIGQIPEHWEAARIKDVVSEIFMGTSPVYEYEEENNNFVFGQRNNQLDGINFDDIKFAKDSFFNERQEYEFLKYGDVLINTLGGGSVGRTGYYDKNDDVRVITDGHIMVLRSKTYDTRYMYYYLLSRKERLENMAIGSTNQSFFNVSDVRVIPIPKPSLLEQKQIAAYLDERCAKIDKAVTIIDKQIDALKRLKRSLINEVVTGKRMV